MLFGDLPDRRRMRLLAISDRLLIYKIYEQGFVTDGTHHHEIGGAIYGDPTCAAIADDESWCAVAGAGLEILLAAPRQTLAATSVGEAHSVAIPWVESLWTFGPRLLGVATAPHGDVSDRRLLYVDVDTRGIHKLNQPD